MIDFKTIVKHSKYVGAIIPVIAAVWAVYQFIDTTYARDMQLQLVELRLDQKILSDKISNLEDRRWRLEDRYGPDMKKAPAEVKEEYHKVIQEQQELTTIKSQLLKKSLDVQYLSKPEKDK